MGLTPNPSPWGALTPSPSPIAMGEGSAAPNVAANLDSAPV